MVGLGPAEVHPKLRLDELIARGSFGEVYRARHLTIARDVAVKILHAAFAPETEAGRLFRHEIRAIGTIDHRNVVRIFDADETSDGRLYFVMELLRGPTLLELAAAAPLPVARAIELVAQLLDGLAAVHEAGHIHADVKPANAVVSSTGGAERVVLLDFGLSRLRPADRPAEAVGGTRAYMAPEQLRDWQVDARSDVFSAALVLVKLLTGEHRTGTERHPSLASIDDPALRALLERALAEDPAARPTAIELARALRGEPHDELGRAPPFRDLAPLTEVDRDRLCGRAADVQRLVRRVGTSKVTVLTAPSGTGKTSLIRAGLFPYLRDLGRRVRYLACEPGTGAALHAALGADEAPEVVIIDQIEIAIANGEAAALIEEALASPAMIVLGVREDFVARLLAASAALAEGVPQVRILPLDRDGARAALATPLAEYAVTLDPPLLAQLLDDLVRVGRAMGLEGDATIYPPHLQLAGAALFDARGPDEPVITLADYARLGGFTAIVAEHLERTLGELHDEDRAIARELLLALVTSAQTRAVRSEVDLVESVGSRHGEVAVRRVIARLESRRLVARTSGIDGVPSWSLVHDTLVPRIETWVTVHDLDRRRMAEVLRFHLRQSQPDVPALLSARQLATLARFPGLVEELEVEWRRRGDIVWTPLALVRRSRKQVRSRRALFGSTVVLLAALTTGLLGTWLVERSRRLHGEELIALNIGRIDLTIELFDWARDASGALVTVPVPATDAPALDWILFDPAEDDPDHPGAPVSPERFARGARSLTPASLVEIGVEVRGGEAFLAISGRGTGGEECAASVIALRHLRGSAEYAQARPIVVRVPTCRASRFETRHVPSSPFVWGGLGIPPAQLDATDVEPEEIVTLPAFEIDRTEITNEAFAVFSAMAAIHEVQPESYTAAFAVANGPRYPRSNLDWFDARAYCAFLGKELPTSRQWQLALRGALVLPSGPNPAPRRNAPWADAPASAPGRAAIVEEDTVHARLDLGVTYDARHPSPVGAFPFDASPYGVLDLAGGVQEWTRDAERGTEATSPRRRARVTRGGNWFDATASTLDAYTANENPRSPHARFQFLGARCVAETITR